MKFSPSARPACSWRTVGGLRPSLRFDRGIWDRIQLAEKEDVGEDADDENDTRGGECSRKGVRSTSYLFYRSPADICSAEGASFSFGQRLLVAVSLSDRSGRPSGAL